MKLYLLLTLTAFVLASSHPNLESKQVKTYPEVDYLASFKKHMIAELLQPHDKSITTTLIDEFKDIDGHPYARYQVNAIGLTPNDRYQLRTYYGGYLAPIDMQVATDADGNLRELLPDRQTPTKPVIITVDALPGASLFLFLISYDVPEPITLTQGITPHPLILKAIDGAELQILRIEKDANFVYVKFRNFKPDEVVTYVSKSGIKYVRSKIPTDKSGSGYVILSPGDPLSKSDQVIIHLIRDNKYSELTFEWSKLHWEDDDYQQFDRACNRIING